MVLGYSGIGSEGMRVSGNGVKEQPCPRAVGVLVPHL